MRRKLLISCIFLVAGGFMLRAQDHPVVKLDTPAVTPGSTLMTAPDFPRPGILPSTLSLPSLDFETKEQRAARINMQTFRQVMTSVDRTLLGYKPPHFTAGQKFLFKGLGLFLSDPNKLPEGCVPLMNASHPFIFAKVPGGLRPPSPYSPFYFAQCIKTEYDFASGTYSQVMVDWSTFQKHPLYSTSQGIFYNAPVPRVNLNPGDAIVNGHL